MRKIAERWSVPGGRPKVSNCKLSGPMATSAAAGARQILKTGLIVACYSHCGMPPQEPTSLPHFLVDRSFAVVWLNFSWLPIGGTPFVRLGAHCLGSRPRAEGAAFGIFQ